MNGGNEDYESGKGQNGFPVTISQVEELGSSSLYVKWKIIDSNGIGGYEVKSSSSLHLFSVFNYSYQIIMNNIEINLTVTC